MDVKQQILKHIHALEDITHEHESASEQKRFNFAKIQIGGFKFDLGAPPTNSIKVEEAIDAPVADLEIHHGRGARILHQEPVEKRKAGKKLGVLKAVGIGLWSAAAASLFQHSFVRAAECLTGNFDTVLASDAAILALVSDHLFTLFQKRAV
jgi:hypothetical protein